LSNSTLMTLRNINTFMEYLRFSFCIGIDVT